MGWRTQLWAIEKVRKGPKILQKFLGWTLFLNFLFAIPIIYYFIYLNPFIKEEIKILKYIIIFTLLYISFRYSIWGYKLLKGKKYPLVEKSNKIKTGPEWVQKGSRKLQIFVGIFYIISSIISVILAVFLIPIARNIYPNLEYLVILPFLFFSVRYFFKGIHLMMGKEYILRNSKKKKYNLFRS